MLQFIQMFGTLALQVQRNDISTVCVEIAPFTKVAKFVTILGGIPLVGKVINPIRTFLWVPSKVPLTVDVLGFASHSLELEAVEKMLCNLKLLTQQAVAVGGTSANQAVAIIFFQYGFPLIHAGAFIAEFFKWMVWKYEWLVGPCWLRRTRLTRHTRLADSSCWLGHLWMTQTHWLTRRIPCQVGHMYCWVSMLCWLRRARGGVRRLCHDLCGGRGEPIIIISIIINMSSICTIYSIITGDRPMTRRSWNKKRPII